MEEDDHQLGRVSAIMEIGQIIEQTVSTASQGK